MTMCESSSATTPPQWGDDGTRVNGHEDASRCVPRPVDASVEIRDDEPESEDENDSHQGEEKTCCNFCRM